ncbi:hypothetical protein [Herpetosiphon giganteus]|uniref:hypothetical protein n=1 Tax=Herpetosiphon giganteus TaxID=2029754 RepID=UPI0019587FB1|nr:hypothetical protein [Herpetosiphon giganteus]MBM7846405.1 hypothetical protein [Herpetosiphon giganteus]
MNRNLLLKWQRINFEVSMTILAPRVRSIRTIYSVLTLVVLGLLIWGVWHLFANDAPTVQGRWQMASQVVEFQSDGMVTGLASEPLRYDVLSATELRLTSADGKQQTATYALSAEQLSLVMLNQQGVMQTHLLQRIEQ